MKTVKCPDCGFEAKGNSDMEADTALRTHRMEAHRDTTPRPQPVNRTT